MIPRVIWLLSLGLFMLWVIGIAVGWGTWERLFLAFGAIALFAVLAEG